MHTLEKHHHLRVQLMSPITVTTKTKERARARARNSGFEKRSDQVCRSGVVVARMVFGSVGDVSLERVGFWALMVVSYVVFEYACSNRHFFLWWGVVSGNQWRSGN